MFYKNLAKPYIVITTFNSATNNLFLILNLLSQGKTVGLNRMLQVDLHTLGYNSYIRKDLKELKGRMFLLKELLNPFDKYKRLVDTTKFKSKLHFKPKKSFKNEIYLCLCILLKLSRKIP